MQNIESILKEIGLEIPADKAEAFQTKFRENYKTVAEVGKIETARDDWKKRAETAEGVLEKFPKDVDPATFPQLLKDAQDGVENARKDYEQKLTQRDQRDWIKAKLDEYGVKSPLARKQITTEVMAQESGLKWQPAKGDKAASFFGFDDYMKAAKAEDATLYQTAEEKAEAEKQAELKKKAPTFTGPTGDAGGQGQEKYVPPKIF